MNGSVLLGIVVGAIIVIAGIAAPKLATNRNALPARQDTATAQSLLNGYSARLTRVEQLAPPAAVKDAKTDVAAAALKKHLDALKPDERFDSRVQALQAGAKEIGARDPNVTALRADESGIRTAVTNYATATKNNAQLLKDATAAAQRASAAADGLDKDYVSAHQALGMSEYAAAQAALAAADNARAQQRRLQAQLGDLLIQWKLSQGSADEYKGLDTGPVLSGLRNDLAAINTQRDETTRRRDELKSRVAQRQGEVDKLRTELAAGRKEMLALEGKGFTAGDDGSFNAYRDAYLQLSERLTKLQADEQILTYGGRRGATIGGDDMATGPLSGGEVVVGLETMQVELAILEDSVTRLNGGQKTLEDAAKHVTEAGESTKKENQRYTAQMDAIAAELRTLTEKIGVIAGEGYKHEQAAAKSAKAAADAFNKSQQMAEKFVAAARDLQTKADPDRANARLKRIIDDQMLLAIGASAEADAQALIARINWSALSNTNALLKDMQRLTEFVPNTTFDDTPFTAITTAARKNCDDALDKAIKLFGDKLAKAIPAARPVARSAVLIAAAAAHHLKAMVNSDDAGTPDADHMQRAKDAIAAAFSKQEKNPYIALHVHNLYRDYLGVAPGAAPGAEGEKKPEGDKKPDAEKKP